MSKFRSAILGYVYSIAKTNMGISSCFFYPKPSNIFNLTEPKQVLDFEQLLSLTKEDNNYNKLSSFNNDNFDKHEFDVVEFMNANFESVDNAKKLSIFKKFSENTLLIKYYDKNPVGLVKTSLLFSTLENMHLGNKKQLDHIVDYVTNNHENTNSNGNQLVLIQEQQYEEFVKSLDDELKYNFEINLVSPPLQEVISEPDIMNGLNHLISTHQIFKKEFKTFNETEKVSLFKILQPQQYMQKLIGFVRSNSDQNPAQL
jgi:hypothetical protein